MHWTEEKILAAAPDALTFERAKALTGPRRWERLYHNDQLAWGVCRGSGEARYDLAAALDRPHFHCSCQSRKRPCKHVLALLLRYREEPGAFRFARDLPVWLAEVKPVTGKKPAAARQIAPRDLVSDERLEKMERGVEELERWLLDLVRQGLAAAQQREADFWEAAAMSMVDAQLKGVRNRILAWPDLFASADWPDRLLAEVSTLFLFAQAFRRRETLPPEAQIDLLNMAGVNLKKDEVLKGEGVRDRWLVLARVEGPAGDNLTFRRTWLQGEVSDRPVLLLDFSWGGQGFEIDWQPGALIEGELVFYPSAYPLRALVRRYEYSPATFEGLSGEAGFEAFAKNYALALSVHPWLQEFPCLLDGVVPVWLEDRLVFVDADRKVMETRTTEAVAWRLIALGGGNPVTVFGEWDGLSLAPLTAFIESRMILL